MLLVLLDSCRIPGARGTLQECRAATRRARLDADCEPAHSEGGRGRRYNWTPIAGCTDQRGQTVRTGPPPPLLPLARGLRAFFHHCARCSARNAGTTSAIRPREPAGYSRPAT